MVFEFEPTIWFVCRLCRDAFSDMEQLKCHKLECHLAESLNIKCIVFEEKLLDYEWIPPPPQFSFEKQDQVFNFNDVLPGEAMKDLKIFNDDHEDQIELKVKDKVLKNPFVSLTKLTAQELNSTAPSAADKVHTFGTKMMFEQPRKFAFAETNRKLLAKQKQNFESDDGLLSFKQRKTADGADDEVLKYKVQELLSSAVIIRSEAYSNTNDRLCFLPQNLPPAPAATSLKVEFIDYGLIADENVEKVSTENPQQILRVNSASQLTSESVPNFGPVATRQSDKTQLKPFVCSICPASFRTKRRLGQHKLSHSENVRLFPCPNCSLKFGCRSNLRKHLVARHGLVTAFKCQFCSKFLSTRPNLISHESSHTGVRPYQCDFLNCMAEFKTNSNLFVHTRRMHGEELGLPQFVCPTCGKSFGLKCFLNNHRKLYH